MTFYKVPKTIALVGMMGVGKTSIGRLLAKRLGLTFKDSDHEVEAAANCTVADIFAWYGEKAFRDTERLVIKRLADEPPHVLSTGVEVFINPDSREIIKKKCISVWLYASLETIYPRVARRSHRPQLEHGDKHEILEDLMKQYYPIYEQADIRVDCDHQPAETTVDRIILEIEKIFLLKSGT
ncbi:shikimate kinase [Candidatus Nucleicultrix amoebiphila]|jgi:shikimate kinase|uniref:Shikimate kinase n=1 Tax=Candidatus Nucleicultrix amoebiphila FS5 TaxID=1414854 RepID=A0A1W6N6A9_9PROT|nr:shikimate kinase [Candidatus Nucleicultrix amoebiphila]ARN85276.1 hypothetical protein GQ61_08225 [Candidatus Nucleicultrix amoebiphila FS5]